ncbi:hypothetical protein TWF106_001458 [Orbilia oligospora]|uniref:ZZ-type domain-containing protein n=1 Tax=Orbilia oligospora TaxID=2813651 RepID=A0A7C8KAD0_ORBOL|nr:hypothetical protein TWF788_010745 [Orbilia oligospora]KAF3198801.1 hypothetical protein TWF191_004763 [Orbilia oligospora]KAF3204662.1 hypothetical protein TWF106_001458 [Orbilia oligospora]
MSHHHPENSNMNNDPAVYTLSEQVSRVSLGGLYDNTESLRGITSRNEAPETYGSNTHHPYETHAAYATEPRNPNAFMTTTTNSNNSSSRFENAEPTDSRKRNSACTACNFHLDPDKPSFQCLKCISYIICGECYMGMLTSPSGFANNHVKDESAASTAGVVVDDHKFEGIPPANLLMRGGKKLHWEQIISPQGEISILFFDVMDAWIEYLDEYHSPGVGHLVSSTAFLNTGDIWAPISKRGPLAIEAQFGDTITKADVAKSFPETLRSHFISGGVRFYDYWAPPRDWEPETSRLVRRFIREDKGPYLDRQGIYEAWFLSLIRDPDDLYGNFISMLDYMPAQYSSRLPPGRPQRALFPSPVLDRGEYGVYDLKDTNLTFYRFPPGKELFPSVRGGVRR